MYKTIEAIYENGKLSTLEEPLPVKKSRVLITVLEEVTDNQPVTRKDLFKFCGILKNWKLDGMEYQKKVRDEWK